MPDFHFITPIIDQENVSTPLHNENKSIHQVRTPQRCKVIESYLTDFSMNESILTESERTPSKSHLLSPDLAGAIFPVEFTANTPKLNYFENLYNINFHRNLPDIVFDGNIEPSPEYNDSGIGVSSSSFYSDNLSLFRSLSVPNTPPSNFKWNREEFRSNHKKSIDNLDISDDENDSDYAIYNNNLQSTKIFDNSYKLSDNSSMFQFSSISKSEKIIISPVQVIGAKRKPLKSFNVSNNSPESVFSNQSSSEESSLSFENVNSNSKAKKLKQSPYCRSSPNKKSHKHHVHFNMTSPISPIISKNCSLKKQISSGARLMVDSSFDDFFGDFNTSNPSQQFNFPISDISPIFASNGNIRTLDSSFIPCMADLDISPIQLDDDELDV